MLVPLKFHPYPHPHVTLTHMFSGCNYSLPLFNNTSGWRDGQCKCYFSFNPSTQAGRCKLSNQKVVTSASFHTDCLSQRVVFSFFLFSKEKKLRHTPYISWQSTTSERILDTSFRCTEKLGFQTKMCR